MNIETALVLICIGVCAGILSGMFGVGGGVVMVPLMVFFLGYGQHQAQGTSLAVLAVPVTFIAAYQYHQAGEGLNWKYALIIALTFVVGSVFGSKIALVINQNILKKLFGVIMLIAAIKLIFTK